MLICDYKIDLLLDNKSVDDNIETIELDEFLNTLSTGDMNDEK